ncbi:MAG: phosphoribosylformylglycinamidine synthase subunit PurL [Phycisphaerae bacterium]
MIHRIEIRSQSDFDDPHAEGIAHQIEELGIETVESVASARLMFLIGELSADDAEAVADALLADPIVETYVLGASDAGSAKVIEVHLQAGVMDPVAASATKAIADMGYAIEEVRTGRRYELTGRVSDAQCRQISRALLANPVIEDVYFEAFTPEKMHPHSYQLQVVEVPIRDLSDQQLEKLSEDGDLFLNLVEMQAIQNYFREIGREPRDVELEMIAQTWSEHCVHKTFRSDVRVRDSRGNVVEEIPNLIKNTVFKSTEDLDKPWCVSVFKDNAGVIEFNEDWTICFKVETHNHPSAIEPYGGASTGIGGVLRDPMGTGLGAKPVANTDVFCFGPTDLPLEQLPTGVLHPRRVMRGVVSGVRDYGNRMGIPTVNGAVYFDKRYLGNPLVFCGTVGLIPAGKAFGKVGAGDAIVVAGGRTGRDGIHGATFSSGELTHTHETEFSHAVQIGNAITEKKMLDTIIQARDAGLYSAITDCGAGGLSSAVGEMGETVGAEVHLDRVPLKYQGLSYDEIWISEAQERMVMSVPQENVEKLLQVFADEDVEAVVIGTFGTDDKSLRLYYDGTEVGELSMEFLHDGLPRPTKEAIYEKVEHPTPAPARKDDYSDSLGKILAMGNVASKEWIIRQYDHEVQGGSVVKPLVGMGTGGPGDAAVVRPVLGEKKGVAISCGMNPHLGDLDPYQSALHAVDEALRNCVSVGGNLEMTAILDNFCWGNCNKPDRMGSFVQAAKGCYDAAMGYQTPFISGKDSLNNEFRTETGETIAIPPTLLISAMSVVDDVSRSVTADAKSPGNVLLLIGLTGAAMGGSHYLLAEGLETGNDVPVVDVVANRRTMLAVGKAIAAGLIRASHDLSEGGLAVAAAELAFAGELGVEIDADKIACDGDVPTVAKLFNESAGRFLIEVEPDNVETVLEVLAGVPAGRVGQVTDSGRIVLTAGGRNVVDLSCQDARASWSRTFDW